MKTLFLFTCLITLLGSTGCIVDDGSHRHWHHDEVRPVVVGPPVVVVRPPEVIVR